MGAEQFDRRITSTYGESDGRDSERGSKIALVNLFEVGPSMQRNSLGIILRRSLNNVNDFKQDMVWISNMF